MNFSHPPIAMLRKIFLFLAIITASFQSCKDKTEAPTPVDICEDGKQNRSETGIDCGGECAECPDLGPINTAFYFQFKLNDSIILLENNYPYFEDNITAFPPQGYKWGANLVYSGKLQDLEGQSLSFKEDATPHIEIMYFNEQNKTLSTAYPPSQSGANCYIRSVKLLDSLITGSVVNYKYIVKGDFNCRISNTANTYTDTITYGKFAIRITLKK